MRENSQNIYKNCRKNAGLTQEQAAELIAVGVRTLGGYEIGEAIPPDLVVCKMVEIYDAPYLAYQHLKESTEVGRRYLPEINISDLSKSILRFQKEFRDIVDVEREMIDIGYDERIDHDEIERWNVVTKEVKEMVGAGLALIYAR